MHEVKEHELTKIKGGGISPWAAVGIGALFVFLIGFVKSFLSITLSANLCLQCIVKSPKINKERTF